MKQTPNSEYMAIYRTTDRFITREIAGEVLLVPVGEQTKLLNGFITFSDSGTFLWKQLSEERTEQELIMLLAAEYKLEQNSVVDDVRSFLRKAEAAGLIQKCN